MSAVLQTPSARLALSRARLREALQGAAADETEAAAAPPPPTGPAQWLADLQSLPGAGLLTEALRAWWARHPLHAAATLVAHAANATLKPIAQRHPLRVVLACAVVGGLVAWSRPWRWVVVPALFAGLLPQLVSAALRAAPPAAASPPPA